MSAVLNLLYHALWIALALLLVAGASAWIARQFGLVELRRREAERALDALARYAEWFALQRRSGVFQGDRAPASHPLLQAVQAVETVFPQLLPQAARLLLLHARALDFLWSQQLLRQRDPESWLETDHDGRYMALWREHQAAVHALAEQLREVAGAPLADAEPESVYPA